MFGNEAEAVREKLAFSASQKCFYFFTQMGQEKQKPKAASASCKQTPPIYFLVQCASNFLASLPIGYPEM